MPSDKSKYLDFINKTDNIVPVFFQPWFLDVVCRAGSWEVKIISDGSGPLGFITYYLQSKYGRKVILNPPFTPYTGILLLSNTSQKTESSVKKLHNTVKSLLDALPGSITWFAQSLDPHFDTGLPYKWLNYDIETRYTFIIPDLKTWGLHSLSTNVRNKINKAANSLKIILADDGLPAYDMLYATLASRGIRMKLSRQHFMDIDTTLELHNRRFSFHAIDENGHILATSYIIFDNETAYLMMINADKNKMRTDAIPFLIYHTILHMKKYVTRFDFEGNMMFPIFNLFAGFGASPTPFLHVSKAKNIFWYLARKVKSYL